ncbi:MAG: CDP-alcohol phosphatidyltransferase family protein [Proteobacteria bacterium]|nr:CDP-alcohol phosphatidyltransferase family protein [Pseudomonadota bacterium]
MTDRPQLEQSPEKAQRKGPWDQRIARFLVRPLVRTRVTPNHITTLRLLSGLGACGCLAYGETPLIHWGAGLFALSNFVDHMDGELARLSGKSSRIGHLYDLASDVVVHIFLFVSIGIGLSDSWLGDAAWIMGIIAGISVSGLFALFQYLETRMGQKQAGLPRYAGFEVEDVLYLIGPAIWGGGLIPILILATIGAPLFGVWALIRYRREIFWPQRTAPE